MTKSEDRLSLATSNWIGLLAITVTVLTVIGGSWASAAADAAVTKTKLEQLSADAAAAKADAAATRTKIDQLSTDVAELKATLKEQRR